ncbi:MAG: YdeI/OmpD-associated family protein [Bacteroidia bacterium]
MTPDPRYFDTPAALDAWFEAHSETATELWVGYYKKDSGVPSITWPESVEVALCYGWIDGIRKKVDAQCCTIRFTPRKPGSIWSAMNIAKVGELTALGLMRPAGLAAYARRADDKSRVYSYEQDEAPALPPDYEARLHADELAWAYFEALPPGVRKTSIHWVVEAKQEATRQRRLDVLIACCAAGERIPMLRRNG